MMMLVFGDIPQLRTVDRCARSCKDSNQMDVQNARRIDKYIALYLIYEIDILCL